MRKTQKTVDRLLAELERTGIPLTACSRVGVGRSTYYRWRQENITFRLKADEAIRIGRENITDLAESKLVKNISDGNQRAIEFQLRHNDSRYRYFNQLEFAKMLENQPEEPEKSRLQTFIEVIFDSMKFEIVEEFSSKSRDEYSMEVVEVAARKSQSIKYLQKLIEAEAERRLEEIHDHYAKDNDAT